MTVKAAPKTFNQFRNFLYLIAGFQGFFGGRAEKVENDRLWAEHQKKKWADDFAKKEAARVAAHPPSTEVPASVPAELHDLYKSFNSQ